MKQIKTFIIAGLFLLLAGCGGTEQDPYAKSSDDIKNGHPPFVEAPKPPDPLAENILTIDSPEHFTFPEGEEQEITIESRSFFENAKFTVEIVNMNDFPGATVQLVEGDTAIGKNAAVKFKWKPPVGTAFGPISVIKMEARTYTTSFEKNFTNTKPIDIYVYKAATQVPEIISIAKIANITEGGSAKFDVVVKDMDATSNSKPNLLFYSHTKGVNAAAYLDVQSVVQDTTDPTLWKFTVLANLYQIEVTKYVTDGYFYVFALSSFGIKSPAMESSFNIWTSVESPATSWNAPIQFKINATNTYSFTVYDPKGEGFLEAKLKTACSTLANTPENAPLCSCTTSTMKGASLSCSIVWKVPDSPLGPPPSKSLKYEVTNKSPNINDPKTSTATFTGIIEFIQ